MYKERRRREGGGKGNEMGKGRKRERKGRERGRDREGRRGEGICRTNVKLLPRRLRKDKTSVRLLLSSRSGANVQ